MAIKIEMLRCLSAVARSGNLRDGADILSKTPSAVSMTLKQFEEHIGQPLFEKDRKNKLTAVGAYVLELAERELQHFDSTIKAIHDFASARQGHVRLAVVPSVAGTVMPRFFAEHLAALERIHLELRDMDSTSVLQELFWDRVDIGIATIGDAGMGIDSTPLMTDRFGVVISAEHPLATDTSAVTWQDLAPYRLISNSLSAGIDDPEAHALHMQANLSAHNLTSILAMVRANVGVTILPEMAIWPNRGDELVFRPFKGARMTRQIQLLRKSESTRSPAEAMVETGLIETVRRMENGLQRATGVA